MQFEKLDQNRNSLILKKIALFIFYVYLKYLSEYNTSYDKKIPETVSKIIDCQYLFGPLETNFIRCNTHMLEIFELVDFSSCYKFSFMSLVPRSGNCRFHKKK